MKLKDLFPENGQVQDLYCGHCHRLMRLDFGAFDEQVEQIRVTVDGIPVLCCDFCDAQYLPDPSREDLINLFNDADERKQKRIYVKRRKVNEEFEYTKVPFLYDADDYYYIPGLWRDISPGFLTPVFFRKEVLIKYANSPSHQIRWLSKSYGEFRKGLEHGISFGINENGKVIMWLGDIGMLPKEEQYYLRSENIDSDHCIGSHFYEAQIEGVFPPRTLEDQLISARTAFQKALYELFGVSIHHLQPETIGLIAELQPPIHNTEKENRHVLDVLYKINVETLDSKQLVHLLKTKGLTPEKLGSLKRLEKLYQALCPEADVARILAPLFVLYDMRIAHAHLHSDSEWRKRMKSAENRLAIPEETASFQTIYPVLLQKIIDCYLELKQLAESH